MAITFTPRNGFPRPDIDEPAAGYDQISDLADAVDARLGTHVPGLSPYTPTWSMQDVGNGASYGRWGRKGNLVYVQASFVAGTTTSLGTGTITCTLPLVANTMPPGVTAKGKADLANNGPIFELTCRTASQQSVATLFGLKTEAPDKGSLVTPGSLGYAFGAGVAGGTLSIQIEYETSIV